jgi:predicted nucleic acid-binding protein
VILVDSSIWVDHLKLGNPALIRLLERGRVVIHAFVVGELTLGGLRPQSPAALLLQDLPPAILASHEEVMYCIHAYKLKGSGIGYVDAHLLASTLLGKYTGLWTRDRSLGLVAERLGVASAG